MTKKVLSLAEKIALTAASGFEFLEDDTDCGVGISAKLTLVSEEYDDNSDQPVKSSLRIKNISLLGALVDVKYSGEKVSREDLSNSGEDGSISEDGNDSGDKQSLGNDMDDEENDPAEDANNFIKMAQTDGENQFRKQDRFEFDVDATADYKTEGFQTLSFIEKKAEMQKGRAVLNQLRIWDALLEARIRLQKMLIDCNRLPDTSTFDELVHAYQCCAEASLLSTEKGQEAVKILMHNLFRLQQLLINNNSETKKALQENLLSSNLSNEKRMLDYDEITSEDDNADKTSSDLDKHYETCDGRKRKCNSEVTETEIAKMKKMKPDEFELNSETMFSSFIPYRDQVIQKWNDKTQFAGGKFNKKFFDKISTLKEIHRILSNKDRLLMRTQVKRSNYTKIGQSAVDEIAAEHMEEKTDPEIFDDDDFYHQLLREVIDRKTFNVSDPIQLSNHWLELQKLRSKLKRKIDTKASKGRRVRYEVYSKLVNFMAPQEPCVMSTLATKELFGSLFGNKASFN